MQGLEIGIGRARGGDLRQDGLRIAQGGRLVEQGADLRGVQPTAAGKARIFQDRKIKLDLGDGLRLRARRELPCRRQFEGSGRKAPIVCLPDLEQGRLTLGREAHLRHPQRPARPRPIKGLERGKIIWIGTLAQRRIG